MRAWILAGFVFAISTFQESDLRRNALKSGLGEALLKECPTLLDGATSDSAERWLRLLEDLTGIRPYFHEKTVSHLERGTRKVLATTRKDLQHLASFHLSGAWRDVEVTRVLCGILEDSAIPLPDSMAEWRKGYVSMARSIPHLPGGIGCRVVMAGPPSPLEVFRDEGKEPWKELARVATGEPDPEKRFNALIRFLEFKDEGTRADVLERLIHSDFLPFMRAAAPARLALVACLEDKSPKIRIAAADRIAIYGIESAEGPLQRLSTSADADVRTAMFQSLVHVAGETSVATFETGLEDADARVRGSALEGLARIRAGRSSGKILKLLGDPEPANRRTALSTLGTLEDLSAADRVTPFLKEPRFRTEAIRTLGLIGHRESIPILLPLLEDVDYGTRHQAALALVRLDSNEILGLRSKLKDDEHLSSELCWELNRFVFPELWHAPGGEVRWYRGSFAQILEAWGKDVGCRIEWKVRDFFKDVLEEQYVRVALSPTVRSVRAFVDRRDFAPYCSLILEAADRISVGHRGGDVAHWERWIKEPLKK